jgi:hypothetical protein
LLGRFVSAVGLVRQSVRRDTNDAGGTHKRAHEPRDDESGGIGRRFLVLGILYAEDVAGML